MSIDSAFQSSSIPCDPLIAEAFLLSSPRHEMHARSRNALRIISAEGACPHPNDLLRAGITSTASGRTLSSGPGKIHRLLHVPPFKYASSSPDELDASDKGRKARCGGKACGTWTHLGLEESWLATHSSYPNRTPLRDPWQRIARIRITNVLLLVRTIFVR